MNEVKHSQRPQKISIGQFYQCGDSTFFLHAVNDDPHVGLACLETGGYWGGPRLVENVRDITPDEFRKLTGKETFTRILLPITITPEA